MDDFVVVIRLNTGEDIIAVMNNDLGGAIRVEHPYYMNYNSSLDGIVMTPYCPYSDEVYYEIAKDTIRFTVTANNMITMKFLDMIDNAEQEAMKKYLDVDEFYDRLETAISNKLYVEGNNTKH